VVYYQQMLWPRRDILAYLVERDYVSSLRKEINAAYFRDVYDQVVSMVSELELINEVLVASQNTYLSVVDNEIAAISNKVSDVMKRLTSFSTLMLPLSFISGLFGMNVNVPWGFYFVPDLVPFYVLLVLMLAYVLIAGWALRRAGWL
jgi:magnesium transporter